jgi:hypothetical protein
MLSTAGWEASSCRGIVFTGVVIVPNKFLVDVQVFPHRVLRVCGAALDGADDDVERRACGRRRE